MVEGTVARLDALPAHLAPLGRRPHFAQPASRPVRRWRAATRPPAVGRAAKLHPHLFPDLPADALARHAGPFGLNVPPVYAAFLAAANGAFCFGMSLAGVPASMLGSPPLLDRHTRQCHDLGWSVFGAE
jgi:hypothetical protein